MSGRSTHAQKVILMLRTGPGSLVETRSWDGLDPRTALLEQSDYASLSGAGRSLRHRWRARFRQGQVSRMPGRAWLSPLLLPALAAFGVDRDRSLADAVGLQWRAGEVRRPIGLRKVLARGRNLDTRPGLLRPG